MRVETCCAFGFLYFGRVSRNKKIKTTATRNERNVVPQAKLEITLNE